MTTAPPSSAAAETPTRESSASASCSILAGIPIGSRIRVDGPTITTFYDVETELIGRDLPGYDRTRYIVARMVGGSGDPVSLYEWEVEGSQLTICKSNAIVQTPPDSGTKNHG